MPFLCPRRWADSRDDLSFGKKLGGIVEEYLMMGIEFIGFLECDVNVARSINKGGPFLDQFSDTLQLFPYGKLQIASSNLEGTESRTVLKNCMLPWINRMEYDLCMAN